MENRFRTKKGYDMVNEGTITYAMEDYLEMIYRNTLDKDYIRIGHIAKLLNVRTSSASKMIQNLKDNDLVDYEKYSVVSLTGKGKEMGKYLLFRHDVLSRLFCIINGSSNELMIVEQIEHYIPEETVTNINNFLKQFNV